MTDLDLILIFPTARKSTFQASQISTKYHIGRKLTWMRVVHLRAAWLLFMFKRWDQQLLHWEVSVGWKGRFQWEHTHPERKKKKKKIPTGKSSSENLQGKEKWRRKHDTHLLYRTRTHTKGCVAQWWTGPPIVPCYCPLLAGTFVQTLMTSSQWFHLNTNTNSTTVIGAVISAPGISFDTSWYLVVVSVLPWS